MPTPLSRIRRGSAACLAPLILAAGAAQAAPLTLTSIGVLDITSGSDRTFTEVFRGDLTAFGMIAAISLTDASAPGAGLPGQYTGFDLDGIKISETLCNDAACAASAPGFTVFDFASGIVFDGGTQRAPVDPALFGTANGGATVDATVATPGAFDGLLVRSAPDPFAGFGWVSLGQGGTIAFNLTALLNGTALYLYIGEVGSNEVLDASVDISDAPVVPAPPAAWLFATGAAALLARARRR